MISSDNTSQVKGNYFGVGGNGQDHQNIPGSGGGGGWYGGISSGLGAISNHYKAVADSGSSYISGHQGVTRNGSIFFTETYMSTSHAIGNGRLNIFTIYTCSDNCLNCTSSSYKLYHMTNTTHKCVTSCPNDSLQIGNECYSCTPGCSSCQNSVDVCKVCNLGYYMFEDKCYSKRSLLNNAGKNLYYGKDKTSEMKQCKQCIGNCVS